MTNALAPTYALRNVVDYLFEKCLAEGAAQKPYLVLKDRAYSFAELDRDVCRAANALSAAGVGIDDRVMFAVRDGTEFPALFLGAMKIGAVAVPINTFLMPDDYAYYLADSGAKAAVFDRGLAVQVGPIGRGIPALRTFFVAGGAADGYPSWAEATARAPDRASTVDRAPDDMAFWLYSSGSTGRPKGVVHTHDHIYWATELFGLRTQGIGPDDAILCPPKMFFAFGLGNQVYFPIRAGASVLADPDPATADAALRKLVEHRPTLLVAVPTLYAAMLQKLSAMPAADVRRAFSRMRFCVSGGEVLPPSLLRSWQDLTGVDILDGVGTTEMTHMFLLNRPGSVVPGSCGRLVEGYSARLVDDDWAELPPGEVGNLFVAGPTAARTYWNKPEKTAATMRDGGVLTGDKFRVDEAGNFFYVGRNDDMLRVGGIWVSPAEVESALAEHPDILECAVIGAADAAGLIKPKAYIVLKGAEGPRGDLEEELRAFLRGRLAHYKCPKWFQFVESLPKTATGKIQRFRLREANEAKTKESAT